MTDPLTNNPHPVTDIMLDPISDDTLAALRAAVAPVMDIHDATTGHPRRNPYSARFRGQLRIDSAEAYDIVAEAFAQHEHTAMFRMEDEQHVVLALPGVIRPEPTDTRINWLLFVLTLLSMLWTGYTLSADEPQPLLTGLYFAVSMLGILLAHELGHYFAARYHNTPVTLPYFIPLPVLSPFGTLGAFIKMQAPVKNRRILLDIGIAGPLAGLVIAIPVVLIGLNMSELITIPPAPPPGSQPVSMMEGNSLLYLGAKYLTFGELLPKPASYGDLHPALYWLRYLFTGSPFPYGALDVQIHPIAWAGWGGLLVTGLNLIPAGQFDGGHTIYVLLGKKTRYLTRAIIGLLLLAGFLWSGWWLWAGLIYFLNQRHAELLDEITPLDRPRWYWAVLTIVVAILVFTPIPLVVG